jgi:hypothetical protein
MPHRPDEILSILDRCCETFTFPMLDNGYLYLAASRLTVHRSASDWALVIEIFEYSPRGGVPDINVHTFASTFRNREPEHRFVNENAYQTYLANNPHNESQFFYPIASLLQDEENDEFLSDFACDISLRGHMVRLPEVGEYQTVGIMLEDFPRVRVFEMCRYLASTHREEILAKSTERRVNVLPEMKQILQLEDWHHPDVCSSELPSNNETFQQLAQVIASNDASLYNPTMEPNTHWKNWPEGGTL